MTKKILFATLCLGIIIGVWLVTAYLYFAPIGMWEGTYIETSTVTWERDPAFVASMFKLQQDDSMWTEIAGLNIRQGNASTIIQEVPTNRIDLYTFGHECLHSYGYTHK